MSEDTPPAVSQSTIDHVFQSLMVMEVELDENPLQFGPRRLNQKTAQARGFLTDCEALFLKVSRWLQKYNAAARAAETSLELGKKHLLANDPEVRAGRNVADRDALASIKLKEEVEELSRIQGVQADLETLLTVIKAKRSDLRDVQGRLRDQIRLCQEEIGLGGQWGSKPPPGRRGPDLDASPNVDKKSLRDLQDMFSGVDVEEESLADVVQMETEPENANGDLIDPDALLAEFEEDEPEEDEPEEDEPEDLDRVAEALEVADRAGVPVDTKWQMEKLGFEEPPNPNVDSEAAATIDALLGDDPVPTEEPPVVEAASSIDELLGASPEPEEAPEETPDPPKSEEPSILSLIGDIESESVEEEPSPAPTKKKSVDVDALMASSTPAKDAGADAILSEIDTEPPKKKDLDIDVLLGEFGV
jgi:hypothetical protein